MAEVEREAELLAAGRPGRRPRRGEAAARAGAAGPCRSRFWRLAPGGGGAADRRRARRPS